MKVFKSLNCDSFDQLPSICGKMLYQTRLYDVMCERGYIYMFRVYGLENHRQRESFNESICCCKVERNRQLLAIFNCDVTESNDFTDVCIFAVDINYALRELNAQITDGVFENSNVGKVIMLGKQNVELVINESGNYEVMQ